MLKRNQSTLIVTCIVILLPILAGLLLWKQLPASMAVHFGPGNKADGFASKPLAVIGLPLFLLACHLLSAWLTTIDPRRQNISDKVFHLILWTMPGISIIVALIMYTYNLNLALDLHLVMTSTLGVLMLILGNYFPKIRHNYTIGIRTPWTLNNEENWNKTHRLGGRVMMATGLILLVACFFGYYRHTQALFVVIILLAFLPILYSLYLHTQKGL